VPVRFILKPGSEAAPLEIENVVVHHIKDGDLGYMGQPVPRWHS
jgi:hypothetical protein